jgi:poly(3-hydroxybutyrate) depolymerase
VGDSPAREPEPTIPVEPPGTGSFTAGMHTDAGQTRRYMFYAPPGAAGPRAPAGGDAARVHPGPARFRGRHGDERLRRRARILRAVSGTVAASEPSRCWNWFERAHQRRGSGEPASLVALVRAVIAQHGVDASRVYVAGLSAGGAMAAIVAAEYPDVFAAVGVHSGLPAGEAENLVQAWR